MSGHGHMDPGDKGKEKKPGETGPHIISQHSMGQEARFAEILTQQSHGELLKTAGALPVSYYGGFVFFA